MASENKPDCFPDIGVGLGWPWASTVAVSLGVGGGTRPLSDGELRRELRRTNSCKGITRDDDCRSEHTLDVNAVAQAGGAAEHIQTGL